MHKIKIIIDMCDDVYYGLKTFEVRKNDRGYKVGDFIRFQPVDSNGNPCYHDIKYKLYKITYVLKKDVLCNQFNITIEDDYVIFSIKELGYVEETD